MCTQFIKNELVSLFNRISINNKRTVESITTTNFLDNSWTKSTRRLRLGNFLYDFFDMLKPLFPVYIYLICSHETAIFSIENRDKITKFPVNPFLSRSFWGACFYRTSSQCSYLKNWLNIHYSREFSGYQLTLEIYFIIPTILCKWYQFYFNS